MDIDKEISLRKEYLSWVIDRMYPVTTKFMIENYRKHGYIEHGKDIKYLPNFEQWKKVYNK